MCISRISVAAPVNDVSAGQIYPGYDPSIERVIKKHFDQFYSLSQENFIVSNVDFIQRDQERFVTHACRC